MARDLRASRDAASLASVLFTITIRPPQRQARSAAGASAARAEREPSNGTITFWYTADIVTHRGRASHRVTRASASAEAGLHPGHELVGRHGGGEQVALGPVAAEELEHLELLVGLDADGHHDQAEVVGQLDGGPHDGGVLLVDSQARR